MNATETDCNNESVDVNFDERNTTDAVDEKLDTIVHSDTYVEEPEYSSGILEIFSTLNEVRMDSEYRPTIVHRGNCYRVSLRMLSDD